MLLDQQPAPELQERGGGETIGHQVFPAPSLPHPLSPTPSFLSQLPSRSIHRRFPLNGAAVLRSHFSRRIRDTAPATTSAQPLSAAH